MNCRHCNKTLVVPFVDLGTAPPSNSYLTEESLSLPERRYPLRVMVCDNCWLAQTVDFADREEFFSSDYAYFSSFAISWVEHARLYVEAVTKRFSLHAGSLVVELAANDGYLLQHVKNANIPCYGIEPTASTAKAAREKGIEIIEEFFERELARKLSHAGRQADLIAANNVLAHVPDINDFVESVSILLKPTGIATFEFPHLARLVENLQFDTVYHEHYSYLSLSAVDEIFRANGLEIFDVEELHTHGGSLRVFVQRAGSGVQEKTEAVVRLIDIEAKAGVKSVAYYRDFQQKIESIKNGLIKFIADSNRSNKKVAAYGAAAKGNTLLNYAGIKSDSIRYVVDRNPAKQGKFMPGSKIPIVSEEYLRGDRPDFVLVLPWNIKDEIAEQLQYVKDWNGKLVVASPRLEILA